MEQARLPPEAISRADQAARRRNGGMNISARCGRSLTHLSARRPGCRKIEPGKHLAAAAHTSQVLSGEPHPALSQPSEIFG
jgi:hypothetical protein